MHAEAHSWLTAILCLQTIFWRAFRRLAPSHRPCPLAGMHCATKSEASVFFPLFPGNKASLARLLPRLAPWQVCTAPPNLRPPLFPGNEASSNKDVCALADDLVHVVANHTGWDWVDEGHSGAHKWGFVSSQVGRTRFWYMFGCMWCVVN